MSPSAAPGPAVAAAGAAEATTRDSRKPRPGADTPAGARKTVHSNPSKEDTTYEQGAYQQRRHRHRPHILDVGQEGQGLPGTGEGREEVTAPTLSAVPDPQPDTDSVPLTAARLAFVEMLEALGVETRPRWTVRTNAALTMLLQASGTGVDVPPEVAGHAEWLGQVAGYSATEAAS